MKYVPNPNSPQFGVEEAAHLAAEFNAINKKYGVITPQLIVQEGSDAQSHIFKHLTWDDQKAADKCRLWEARQLIASVYLLPDDDSKPEHAVRAFVNIRPEQSDDWISEQTYKPIAETFTRPNFKEQVLGYAHAQLKMWRKKFGDYKEFTGVVSEIDKL